MHKNRVWLGFLAMVIGAVGWYTIKTLYVLYLYSTLNASTTVDQIQWSVKQEKEDRFFVQAHYEFDVEKQKYSGETLFFNDVYWNSWAAEDAVKFYQNKEWQVWYSLNNPQHSSLQKNFPLKELISASVLWLLLVYFVGLGYYAAKKKVS